MLPISTKNMVRACIGCAERQRTPKVIFRVARKNVIFENTLLHPVFANFKIWLKAILGVALKIGDIQSVLGKFVDLG